MFLVGCKTGSSGSTFNEVGGNGAGSAVASTNAAVNAANVTNSFAVPASESLDIINAHDLLTIVLTDTPIGIPIFEDRVQEDGTVTLTENQKFNVVGKKRGQLADEIHDRYVPRFFRRMTVSVAKKESTQFYYVGGEVKAPARQVYISRITVLKAIQSVGWFTDYANKSKVQLTRADGRMFIINCKKAIKDPKLDLEVYPGDTVIVPRRSV
jgi:protein involved in polysaccharide export with SLBB domain